MKYSLVVLTHGDGPTLERCLDSFGDMVSPAPSTLHIVRDGPGYSYVPSWVMLPFVVSQVADDPVGFCRATRFCWKVMAAAPTEYVFHLEHDFVFTRPVDLGELAFELDREHRLAQMALMRDAVNEQEIAAGGLFESRASEYEPRWAAPTPGDEFAPAWHEHRSYFTTNPSLMRRAFVSENPWLTDDGPYCEGRYGLDLVARGYRFGVWGAGEPWVEHVGTRTGFGY